jgi:hypothetical protein
MLLWEHSAIQDGKLPTVENSNYPNTSIQRYSFAGLLEHKRRDEGGDDTDGSVAVEPGRQRARRFVQAEPAKEEGIGGGQVKERGYGSSEDDGASNESPEYSSPSSLS